MSPKEIRYLRHSLGMSQEQFAASLYVTRETVGHWERGSRKPLRALVVAMQRLARQQQSSILLTASAQRLVPTRVKRLRKTLGISQRELAEQLKVERETVARWETGAQLPHPVFVAGLNELSLRVTKQICLPKGLFCAATKVPAAS